MHDIDKQVRGKCQYYSKCTPAVACPINGGSDEEGGPYDCTARSIGTNVKQPQGLRGRE